MAVKTFIEEQKRKHEERTDLSLAKKKQKEEQRAFKQMLARERAEKLEELARQGTVREKEVAVQKKALTEAIRQKRLARDERRASTAILHREQFETFKSTIKPAFKPVKLGGLAMRKIAQAGLTHFYVLGTKPTNSPSYTVLENAFGAQPFSIEQATTVIMNSRMTDYADAVNRLRTMKSYGYIREA